MNRRQLCLLPMILSVPAAAEPERTTPSSSPFTGSMRVRQKGGDLYYDFEVRHGKVLSGVCAFRNRKKVMYQVVDGWYDGDRLTLMLQSTADEFAADKFFSHMAQFRRSAEGFVLEHELFDCGKTEASGILYKAHIIDYVHESPSEGAGEPETPRSRKTPKNRRPEPF
jgi:hypothetical protein